MWGGEGGGGRRAGGGREGESCARGTAKCSTSSKYSSLKLVRGRCSARTAPHCMFGLVLRHVSDRLTDHSHVN